jgi:hypothetical protein
MSTINVLHIDQETGVSLWNQTYTVISGPYGPYYALTFPGYQRGSMAAGGSPASGIIAAGETRTIIYLYSKMGGDGGNVIAIVNVLHKDRETNVELRSDTYPVVSGNYGPYSPLKFSGYETGSLSVGSAPAEGFISTGQTITITYLYSKSPVITVEHKDRDTGGVLKSDMYSISPGYYGPYNALEFQNYGLGSLSTSSDPAYGTINIGESRTITYLYNKVMAVATIIIVHKDMAGNVLGGYPQSIDPGNYGPYGHDQFSGLSPNGLAVGSAPASGMIAAGETKTIIFLYSDDATPPEGTATINVIHWVMSALGDYSVENDTLTVNAGSYPTLTSLDPSPLLTPLSNPKRTNITRFLKSLVKHDDLVAEFDDELWYIAADSIKAYEDGRLVVIFRDGSEVSVAAEIWKAV